MYLSKLEIFGFKSFASKTSINFTKGITGIVGPNGCGKTNIVDGIRWVLGEQKSSTLRSDKMENVIFNGTRNKKPMGMAEISLTLVNDRNVLPTEYSEVTITRRIFRSGESEYLLNKNICRLKDITNLFMDTGMGTNAYSVIELKMVETILSNKADERRNMFEEAAGVNKYKLRRRLSLKKLDEVKADLIRVNDIVAEVEKNVRSLQRQAKKADKYNQIQSILREKEIELAERQFSRDSIRRQAFESEKYKLDEKKLFVDSEIKRIENSLIELRGRIRGIEEELSIKQSELGSESEKLHSIQNIISVAEERERSLSDNLQRYTDELNELRTQSNDTNEDIKQTQELILEAEQKIDSSREKINGTENILSEKKTELDLKKDQLKNYSDRAIEIHKKINYRENDLNALKKSLAITNEEIEKLNLLIQKTTNNIAKSVGFLEELSDEKQLTQRHIDETDQLLSAQQKEKERIEAEISDLRQKELDEKNVINALRNKIDLLQTMISNLEGVSKASKLLIENEGWSKKEKTLFADVGKTDEKYRFALEAALKFVLNNLLIENIDDLKTAIKFLKENDLGKASFFLLNGVENRNSSIMEKIIGYSESRRKRKIERDEKFIGWAFNFVETKPKWEAYFKKVLDKTAITDSLDSAIQLSKKYPSFSFATLNGDLVRFNGIVEAGSLPKADETLFGRKQQLEDLISELPLYEQNLKKLQNYISELSESLEKINLQNISDKGRLLLNELNNIDKQISQIEFEKNKYSEEIESAQKKIQSLAGDATSIDNQSALIQNEISTLKKDEISANEALAKFETELKHFEHEYDNMVSEQNQQKLDLERLLGKLENERNEIKRLDESKERIKLAIDKREKEIVSIHEEISSIKNTIEEKKGEFSVINDLRLKLVNEENGIKDRLSIVKTEASGFETELNKLRNERQQISDTMHELDIQISELKMKLENMLEHIKEEYSLNIEFKEFEDNDSFDFKYASDEVHEYKQQLKSLGPINLLAYSEYEEENERLEFLTRQRDDLIKSEKDLVKTIEEINEAAEKLFLDTFAQIRENFIKIFQSLFNPGDEADLILQEGVDPLEAKIEIMAKPKGKRPTSIELLSGGEKTLTATALLFAIYLVKPSPFCILDEVDAPLDDANIDRFTKLLKEFSSNTQFIIVTHNKRTMNAAENMYGVTMQEEGISKIAGVQFNDDFNLN
ncbi:MAG: chromosome segregation protein SMC [Melioribacteraceae bacterium]|nr:chromosome segregation protein SMC [Melioribacteraceae bacterium]